MNQTLYKVINSLIKAAANATTEIATGNGNGLVSGVNSLVGDLLPDPTIMKLQKDLQKACNDLDEIKKVVHQYISIPIISQDLDLEELDYNLLKRICENEIEVQGRPFDADNFLQSIVSEGYDEEDIYDSLEVLENRDYIIRSFRNGRGLSSIHALQTKEYGFDTYCENEIENWESMKLLVAQAIQEHGKRRTDDIIDLTGYPRMIVVHIIEEFDSSGFLGKTSIAGNGRYMSKSFYKDNYPELKRLIKSLMEQ